MKYETVGVVGGGKFGLALAKLLAHNADVILYSRRSELIEEINKTHAFKGIALPKNVRATTSLEEICMKCTLIFPVISSAYFREVIKAMSPYISPRHILIHGTKGFDLLPSEINGNHMSMENIRTSYIKTMSDVILEETDAIRIGSLCGPNLATEILDNLPTATVIASEFDEVIMTGKKWLAGKTFFVFGSHDLKGAELAGAFKNVIALASGLVGGKQLGKNAQAMLITRGLREMILLGELMGSSSKAFLGTAGIGDLIATCTSKKSRNYSFGMRISQGETVDDILNSQDEVVEGVRSLKITYHLIKKFGLHAPIISAIYDIIYLGKDIERSVYQLMKYPIASDVDFV